MDQCIFSHVLATACTLVDAKWQGLPDCVLCVRMCNVCVGSPEGIAVGCPEICLIWTL